MQLTCKINQNEAIKRGFDTNSTIKLDVNPANLTQAQRDVLAIQFIDGNFGKGFQQDLLNEPTLAGLLETIDQIATKKAEEAQRELERKAEVMKRTQAAFAERKSSYQNENVFVNLVNGIVKVCEQHDGDRETKVEHIYGHKTVEKPYPCDITEWDRLIATQEGIAWKQELDAANEASYAEAVKIATKRHHAKVAAIAKQEASLETLRQWAITHGSEELRLRIEEDFEWKTAAREEWAAAALTIAKIQAEPCETPDGYDCDCDCTTSPNINQIKTLREIREALSRVQDLKFKVDLIDCKYTEDDNEYGDPDIINRTEVRVKITDITDSNHYRYFLAE